MMAVDDPDDVKENYIISSLVRGLQILSVFSISRPELKVSEIAEITGLNQSTVFRFIYTLEQLGYLIRDEDTKKYHQSVRMLTLALAARASIAVREVALPYMFELNKRINESVKVAVLDEVDIVTIATVEAFNKLVHHTLIGQRSPAYCTALGKVLLAYQPFEEWDHLISKIDFTKHTEKTIVDPVKFRDELIHIRRNGYAIQDGEYIPALGSIAAPIFDHGGQVAAAINISGLSLQIVEGENLAPLLTELSITARAISTALGYTPEMQ